MRDSRLGRGFPVLAALCCALGCAGGASTARRRPRAPPTPRATTGSSATASRVRLLAGCQAGTPAVLRRRGRLHRGRVRRGGRRLHARAVERSVRRRRSSATGSRRATPSPAARRGRRRLRRRRRLQRGRVRRGGRRLHARAVERRVRRRARSATGPRPAASVGCQAGTPAVCDDDDSCTVDACDEAQAACTHDAADARSSTRSTRTASCSRSIPGSSAAPAPSGDWPLACSRGGCSRVGRTASSPIALSVDRTQAARVLYCERGDVQRVHRGRVVQPDVVRTAPGRDGRTWAHFGMAYANDGAGEDAERLWIAGGSVDGSLGGLGRSTRDPPRLVGRGHPGNG